MYPVQTNLSTAECTTTTEAVTESIKHKLEEEAVPTTTTVEIKDEPFVGLLFRTESCVLKYTATFFGKYI
jgi:hypothetical protein